MSKESIHELLKQVYPLSLRMELFNAIWTDLIKEGNEIKSQLELTGKALQLAVKDKCKFENKWFCEVTGFENAELVVPRKEQYYLERAKEILKNERKS